MIRVRSQEFVFTNAPTPECHASTVAVLPSGELVVAWFGGTHEKHPDVGIWLARRSLAGVWSPSQCVAKYGEIAHWNPVLLATDNQLHLWFKIGATIPHWRTFTQVSDDGGATWSEARELVLGDVSGGRGPVKNKPIVLSSGDWLAGASSEQTTWEAFFDRSTDGGATWQRTPNLDRTALGAAHGIIQPTLWETTPGTVHALLRSSCGYAPRTDSTDGGITWSPVYDSGLPNNNSGLDLVKLDDGRLALVYNPVTGDWGPRTPLRVSISDDNGQSWNTHHDLIAEPGEFSYPAVVLGPKNTVVTTYTHNRKQIACAILEID